MESGKRKAEIKRRPRGSSSFPLSAFHFLLSTTLLLGACANQSPKGDPPAAAAPQREPEQARDGLEVVWWVTDDSEGRVGEALAHFIDPPLPTDEALRERWRASGLRMVRVAIDDFPQVQAALPPAAQRFRQPIGWATNWIEVFRGRRAPGATLMIAGLGRSLPLAGRGVVRFLARCWPTPPAPNTPAAVRFDLAFQFEPDPAANPNAADPFAEPAPIKEEDRGESLRELSLAASIEPGYVYLLTCESPATNWTPRAEKPHEDTGFSPPDEIAPAPAPATKPVGPVIPAPITLAEAIMQTEPDETNPRRFKAIVAFIVRGKSEFRLLR